MSLIAGNLAVVQRLLDSKEMMWAVFAGAAAHLYGNRRPIQDVDIVIMPGQMSSIVQLFQSSGKAVQFDGQRIIWRGIKIFDDLSVRRDGAHYPLSLDAPMQARLRKQSLLGAPVPVVAPEDVVVHKLLLDRGTSFGKFDVVDVEGILRRQTLDLEYLRQRLQLMQAETRLLGRLREMGIAI
ncbi:hypothetical protein OSCT_1668 [Oscillochloris trichoides DG-6]|uniref:Uncharacterized protein n=1 Tax=Oscillochloris trichoides DG-6 TaxID=765420 RepID=E1IEB7_9CHLR|nr:hypothetical protein [Oscillochloris trichoides]EFO80443.1 hypothetical protein OSCT_1668 [Oscillochloris trichoides DG-6]